MRGGELRHGPRVASRRDGRGASAGFRLDVQQINVFDPLAVDEECAKAVGVAIWPGLRRSVQSSPHRQIAPG